MRAGTGHAPRGELAAGQPWERPSPAAAHKDMVTGRPQPNRASRGRECPVEAAASTRQMRPAAWRLDRLSRGLRRLWLGAPSAVAVRPSCSRTR